MTVAEKVQAALNSEIGNDIKVLAAYAIKESNTLTDDEILQNADVIAAELSKSITEIANMQADTGALLSIVLPLLEKLAAKTSTKWDDRAIKILKMFL